MTPSRQELDRLPVGSCDGVDFDLYFNSHLGLQPRFVDLRVFPLVRKPILLLSRPNISLHVFSNSASVRRSVELLVIFRTRNVMIISAGTSELSRRFSTEASNSSAAAFSGSVKVMKLDIQIKSLELQ